MILIWCADDHGIQVGPFEHLAIILENRRVIVFGSHFRGAFFVDVASCCQLNIRMIRRFGNMPTLPIPPRTQSHQF